MTIQGITALELGHLRDLAQQGLTFSTEDRWEVDGVRYRWDSTSKRFVSLTTVDGEEGGLPAVQPDQIKALEDRTAQLAIRAAQAVNFDAVDRIANDRDSAAFLQKATLGPTLAEIQALTTLGSKRAWVLNQLTLNWSRRIVDRMFTVPAFTGASLVTNFGEFSMDPQTNTGIVTALLQEPAALRSSAVWALSKLFVVSHPGGAFDDIGTPYCFGSWFDRLNKHVFGNWRDLIESVTYSLHMSRMLTYYANQKGNAEGTTQPDENYARELLQLFTIGLYQMNRDGTYKLDGDGNRIPTYGNTDIRQVARCLTGLTRWNFNNTSEFYDRDDATSVSAARAGFGTGGGPGLFSDPDRDLVHFLPFYEYGAKKALGGLIDIPEGIDPVTNLKMLHDALFYHPNTAPFFATRMIQHFVTSQPSPAYVERVAAAFEDNGQGVRGDLKAVWMAVLTDPEAASDGRVDPKFGRIRDGWDLWANITRSFNRRNSAGQISISSDGNSSNYSINFGPTGPRMQPSIFSAYDPLHSPPELDDRGILAPEAQMWSDVLLIRAMNELIQIVITGESTDVAGNHTRISDYTMLPLTDTAANLIERVNLLMCGGHMSAGLRASMQSLIGALPVSTTTEQVNRVAVLLQCVSNSPDFWVQL